MTYSPGWSPQWRTLSCSGQTKQAHEHVACSVCQSLHTCPYTHTSTHFSPWQPPPLLVEPYSLRLTTKHLLRFLFSFLLCLSTTSAPGFPVSKGSLQLLQEPFCLGGMMAGGLGEGRGDSGHGGDLAGLDHVLWKKFTQQKCPGWVSVAEAEKDSSPT